MYNENTENDQIKLLDELQDKLQNLNISFDTNLIVAGDLNFFFDASLEATGGPPTLKKRCVKIYTSKRKLRPCRHLAPKKRKQKTVHI